MSKQFLPHRIEEKGLQSPFPYNMSLPFGLLTCLESKVVFLNRENQKTLEGYKAKVRLCKCGEIHIILTGFSEKSAKALYDQLAAMNPEDIYSDKEKTTK